jgi:hypothetical protein
VPIRQLLIRRPRHGRPGVPSGLAHNVPGEAVTGAVAALAWLGAVFVWPREAGFRCLAWSPEAGLTWVNVMLLISDEASHLSVPIRFRGVSCTDSCTRQLSGHGF